jgi:hypothetical protein
MLKIKTAYSDRREHCITFINVWVRHLLHVQTYMILCHGTLNCEEGALNLFKITNCDEQSSFWEANYCLASQ